MQKHRILLSAFVATIGLSISAQYGPGGLSQSDLETLATSYEATSSDKAIQNALASGAINTLALNQERMNNFDTHFSHKVPSKGISNQKSSGRCWLFTGLNVLRAQMMDKHNLPMTELSQNYNFFYDQLEKANLFLQAIIDTSELPLENQKVDWLFKNPINDGGQFTGVADLITKYGVVPAEVMPETNSSNNTSKMSNLIGLKLKEYGLELRDSASKGAKASKLADRKTEMLGDIYRMLVLNLGEPPTEFEWTVRDANGKAIETKTFTPKSFYDEFIGNDLQNNYVMLMNDPTREYYKLYEIEYDRHTYDGKNWTYINLPVEEIKEMAIASLKDNTAMYFSCDVGKFLDRERGVLDIDAFDYGSLLGTTFGMDKKERILTHSSGSSHAMTLVAVNVGEDGKPNRWLVENSWGPGANNGHLAMTDPWFDEYMFRLVVDKKYLTPKATEVLKQKAILLPPWDPMFSADI